MRNLIRFIIRYNFTILFLILEIIALIFIFQNNPIQRGYLSDQLNSFSSLVYDGNYRVTRYLSLRSTNEQLVRENSRLRSLAGSVGDELAKSDSLFEYIPANVINNSVNKVYNYLTLDVGSDMGIEPDMGVISPGGIVGVIKAVSPGYCRVISLLNNQLMISVKLSSSGYFGSVSWPAENYREVVVSEIPSHVIVEPGDSIVTSGYSSIFPPDELVAVVLSSKTIQGSNFQEITARLANDFKKLSKVYIVKHNKKEELLQIEEER